MQEVLLALVIKAFDGVSVHAEADLDGALAYIARHPPLDVVLLDLGLQGYAGVEAMHVLKARLPRVPIAIVSAHDEREIIVEALKGGAAGYITKNSPQRIIVAALRLIGAGGVYLPAQCVDYLEAQPATDAPADHPLVHKLTERQRQVLRLLLQGRSNSQVAEELDIREGTVKQHAHAIYEAVSVSSRAELFALAARGGIRRDGSPITKDL